MVEELLKVYSVLGVSLEQVVEEVGEEGRGAGWYAGRQPRVLLVELLQRLRGLGLQIWSSFSPRLLADGKVRRLACRQ